MRWIVLIFMALPHLVYAQFSDNFSDGDFTDNPVWAGDTARFKINSSLQLQLNASGEGISELLTSGTTLRATEWRVWIRLPFSPSVNNFARIYLASDQPTLKGDLNGYFLQVGEAGSADALELFRQTGQNLVSVCRGRDTAIASSFRVRVKITCSAEGNWKLFADYNGGENYQPEAEGTDNTHATSSYFGIYCKYTSSNSAKFYFDDFYAGPVIIDQEPPHLLSASAKSDHMVSIKFSEGVEKTSSENIQNYMVNPDIGTPDSAKRSDIYPDRVELYFEGGLETGALYTLTTRNIEDFTGNAMPPETAEFAWYPGQTWDIVINEIMADPSPVVGLPDYEYLELYNNSGLPVPLTGWSLILGSTVKTFGEFILPAGGYLIIADDEAESSFATFGAFYGFSSISLSNEGTPVTLVNAENRVIHHVSYTVEWYHHEAKADGGWSLELKDPLNPCGGKINWQASENYSGGTPGSQNSVYHSNPDETAPKINRVTINSETRITVFFTESMDSLTLFNPNLYLIDQDVGNPLAVQLVSPEYNRVILLLPDSLKPDTRYHLSVDYTLSDCAGNIIGQSAVVRFGLPVPAVPGDIVINEILFNPRDDLYQGVDFVELFNRSPKIIELGQLMLAGFDTLYYAVAQPKEITSEGFLLFPGEFMVLTEDPEIVKLQYWNDNPDQFLTMESLPAYHNELGTVVLCTRGFEIIDRVRYSEKMHFPLLLSFDGVSLERVNPELSSDLKTNWHSAASTVGFATPGMENSQYRPGDLSNENIIVEPEIFSPDNDGHHDYLNIHLTLDDPGNMVTITVFDQTGTMKKQLVKNEMAGIHNSWSWDGTNDENQKEATGIYVLLIEVFNLEGKTIRMKKTAVKAK